MFHVDHAQYEREAAVASAVGGASANPALKLALQSLTASVAGRLSSLMHRDMAGIEIKDIDAIVPKVWLESRFSRSQT